MAGKVKTTELQVLKSLMYRSLQIKVIEFISRYCIAEMYRNKSNISLGNVQVAVVCFEEISRTSDIETSGILSLISVFFLAATIAVYTFLPQLR